MATCRSSQLEDRMCCTVCFEQYDNSRHVPKILPCQHTFCQACITQTMDKDSHPSSLHCPICRRRHSIPRRGFITNRAVMDIIDELGKETKESNTSGLKCKKHGQKKVVFVCIDCLDPLCATCVKSSMHVHSQHHVEEVDDAAPILQRKFQSSQHSLKKKLALLEELPCSSTELDKAKADVKLMSTKLSAEIVTWENEQLAMIQRMSHYTHTNKNAITRCLETTKMPHDDVEALLHIMKQRQRQTQLHINVEDYEKELYRRLTVDQTRFNESILALPDKLRAFDSENEIQSKFLKPGVTPDGSKILYKVEAIGYHETDPINRMLGGYMTINPGDIIAVTAIAGLTGLYSQGLNEATGEEGWFRPQYTRSLSDPIQPVPSVASSTAKTSRASMSQQADDFPAQPNVLYKVKVTRNEVQPFLRTLRNYLTIQVGEVIAVRDECGGGTWLWGFQETTGLLGWFRKDHAVKITGGVI